MTKSELRCTILGVDHTRNFQVDTILSIYLRYCRYDTFFQYRYSIKVQDNDVDNIHICTDIHTYTYRQTNYSKVLWFKNKNMLTVFGFMWLCLMKTSSPTLENNLSEGTEVPGMQRYFWRVG